MDGFPSWASWSYKDHYLPKDVHKAGGVLQMLKVLNRWKIKMETYGQREYAALAVGLVLRDVDMKGSLNEGLPLWVKTSAITQKEVQGLMTFCQSTTKPTSQQVAAVTESPLT